MLRDVARSRAFPVLAWAYLVALGVQVFFAGMFVFVGAGVLKIWTASSPETQLPVTTPFIPGPTIPIISITSSENGRMPPME